MLKGRLGLETARIPYADRHGLLWLSRGRLYVEEGTLRFATAGCDELRPGDYHIPLQMVTTVLLGPGSTVSHDAMRLLARQGTGLVAVGTDGIRFYASMPFGQDDSALARKQVEAWSDRSGRYIQLVRLMYAWRLGEVLPSTDLDVLRGMEGARVKRLYADMAAQYGIPWSGRCYDRQNPNLNDVPNMAINHAASAIEAAAMIAVASTSTIPQLGFIHEDSRNAFCLDIADLFRDSVTLPVAFGAAREHLKSSMAKPLEPLVRRIAGKAIRREGLVPKMIDRIKELFDAHDGGGDT